MAKKSLKKRIDDLIDALGGAEKPTFAKIRSELVSIGTLVEALEDAHDCRNTKQKRCFPSVCRKTNYKR